MKLEKQAPCPFCGKNDELEYKTHSHNSVTEWHIIKCKPCKCSLTGLSFDGVKQRWNNRVSNVGLESLFGQG